MVVRKHGGCLIIHDLAHNGICVGLGHRFTEHGIFGKSHIYFPSVICAVVILSLKQEYTCITELRICSCQFLDYLFAFLGFDLSLGIGNTVEMQSLEIIIVTVYQGMTHLFFLLGAERIAKTFLEISVIIHSEIGLS